MLHSLDALHVVAVKIDGGVPVYVRELVQAQLRAGLKVRVACDQRSVLWATLSAAGGGNSLIPWTVETSPKGLASSAVSLRRLVSRYSPEVVHLHSSVAGFIGRGALGGLPNKLIFQPHSWSFHAVPAALESIAHTFEWMASAVPDLVICGSNSESEELSIAGRARRSSLVVVPNFVDTGRFHPVEPELRSFLQSNLLGSESPTAVQVARLAHQKGADRLLAAWPAVRRLVPNARLVLVGDGPMLSKIELAATAGVVLVGAQDDPGPWHQLANVGVYPSRYETMSLAVLESLASGTPVVSSGAGGMRQALTSESGACAGEIVEDPDDAQALATAIARWLQPVDKASAAQRRALARERAEHFDVSLWFKAMEVAYSTLVSFDAKGD